MEAKYKNRSRNGLKNNHEYVVKFSKPSGAYVYDAHFIYDITEKEEIDIVLNYASEKSIKNNFDIKVLRLED